MNLSQNIRYALRRIRRHPLYAITIIACLALGIGANTAIFSVIDTLLFRPLPVEDADRLAVMLLLRENFDPMGVGPVELETFEARSQSFEELAITDRITINLLEGDRPERVEGSLVDGDYLQMVGVQPVMGRVFTPEDNLPDGPPITVIGHGLWQRRFAADPDILGQTIRLEDGGEVEIVGVLPEGFDMPTGSEMYMPMRLPDGLPIQVRASTDFLITGRLKPGVTFEQANEEADALLASEAEEYPEQRSGWGVTILTLRQHLFNDLDNNVQRSLYLLVAVVGFLLLIACANVASLLLIRSLERGHEVAVQTALGAGRRHLVTELVTESVLLALLGGAAGLLVAYWITPFLLNLSPVEALALGDVFGAPKMDGKVLLFALGVSLLTAVLFGLAPALRTALPGGLVSHLKEGGNRASASRGGRKLLGAFVVTEIAVAVVLLLGAGLAAKSFADVQNTDLGFEPGGKLTLELPISRLDFPEHEDRIAYVERLIRRMEELPEVANAEVVTTIPLEYNTYDLPYTPEGMVPSQDSEIPVTAHRLVTPGYLKTMGMRLLEGRLLTEQDRNPDAPVVVITEEMARRSWPGQSALGKQVSLGYPPSDRYPPLTVVGVLSDTKEDRFNFTIDRPAWYISYHQMATSLPDLFLVLETTGDPEAIAPAARRAVWEVNEDQPVVNVKSMQQGVDNLLGPDRFAALLMTVFAALGLVLAAVGLYGLISYWVAQSTQEIGVRMAMGAESGDLMKLTLGRGLRLTALGLVLGLAVGWGVLRLLSGTVEQLSGADPVAYLVIVPVLLLVALLATYLPARRAVRVDPNSALRYE